MVILGKLFSAIQRLFSVLSKTRAKQKLKTAVKGSKLTKCLAAGNVAKRYIPGYSVRHINSTICPYLQPTLSNESQTMFKLIHSTFSRRKRRKGGEERREGDKEKYTP